VKLIRQADAPALLTQIQQDARPFFADLGDGATKLLAAIALLIVAWT